MKKKMLIWIGAAALATVAVACSKKNAGTTPVENAPAAAPGGDAYGGAKYGTPAPEAAPPAAPAPESK
jgi:hypothetical protein